jgi:hypothetical protein
VMMLGVCAADRVRRAVFENSSRSPRRAARLATASAASPAPAVRRKAPRPITRTRSCQPPDRLRPRSAGYGAGVARSVRSRGPVDFASPSPGSPLRARPGPMWSRASSPHRPLGLLCPPRSRIRLRGMAGLCPVRPACQRRRIRRGVGFLLARSPLGAGCPNWDGDAPPRSGTPAHLRPRSLGIPRGSTSWRARVIWHPGCSRPSRIPSAKGAGT